MSVSSTVDPSVYLDFKGLESLRRQGQQTDSQKIEAVAKQFEAMFLQIAFKHMRQANQMLNEEGIMQSDQMGFYQELYDQQLALSLSKQGLGFAKMLTQQLGAEPSKPVIQAERSLVSANQIMTSPVLEMAAPAEKLTYEKPEDFVTQLWQIIEPIKKQLALSPKLILAQAALETGWGKAIASHENGRSSFNLFGIKADEHWQRSMVETVTHEFKGGQPVKIKDKFRSYGSFLESIHDYMNYLKSNPRYQEALHQLPHAKQFLTKLQQAGYATDPHYADKIMAILNSKFLNHLVEG